MLLLASMPVSPAVTQEWKYTRLDAFGAYGLGVAWGDFDGDGRWDVAVADTATGFVHLFRNNGDGTFTESRPFNNAARFPAGVVCGDLDNDGRTDLIEANSGGLLYTHLNQGNLAFSEETLAPQYSRWHGLSLGDYNNDCWMDLLAATESADHTTRLFRNTSEEFTETGKYFFGSSGAAWIDLDSDGLLDIVLSAAGFVYENCGQDSFAWHPLTGLPQFLAYHVSVGDFNNDGRLDLGYDAQSMSNRNQLAENIGGFYFTVTAPFGGSAVGTTSCGWADCNNDGFLDMAMGFPNSVSIFLGDGTGSFAEQTISGAGPVAGLAWCDYDDDGDLDVAVTNPTGGNFLLRNETNDSDFVKVRFDGRGKTGYSNLTGIGVRVGVLDGQGRPKGLREISGGTGYYACMDAPEAHFGVSAGDTFTVLVTWPASGIVDTIPSVIPPARLKVVENRRPGPFSLASPAKGAEVSRKPTLAWHKAVDPDGDVVTYDLWYGKDPSLTTRTEVKGLSDTTWTPSALLDSAAYYWKVLAIDREHRVISYRNHYTDTMAVDSIGAQTWCNEQDWYFNATAAGMAEGGQRQPGVQISLSVGQNPARGAVRVGYTAAAGGLLEVFSADGRLTLARPVHGTGTLALGRILPQGVYFVRLTAAGQVLTAKVVRLR